MTLFFFSRVRVCVVHCTLFYFKSFINFTTFTTMLCTVQSLLWIIVDASIVLTNCSDHNFLSNIFSICACTAHTHFCIYKLKDVCVKWFCILSVSVCVSLFLTIPATCVNRVESPCFATETLTNLINDSSQFLSIGLNTVLTMDIDMDILMMYGNGKWKLEQRRKKRQTHKGVRISQWWEKQKEKRKEEENERRTQSIVITHRNDRMVKRLKCHIIYWNSGIDATFAYNSLDQCQQVNQYISGRLTFICCLWEEMMSNLRLNNLCYKIWCFSIMDVMLILLHLNEFFVVCLFGWSISFCHWILYTCNTDSRILNDLCTRRKHSKRNRNEFVSAYTDAITIFFSSLLVINVFNLESFHLLFILSVNIDEIHICEPSWAKWVEKRFI